MENINMATVKTRTGPKPKDPEAYHKPVVHYATIKEIKEFGGGDYEKGIELARDYAAQTFAEFLDKIRTKKARPGKF